MQVLDRQELETPVYRSRRMRVWLERQGMVVGMDRPKRQIFVDSFTFEVPKPEGKPKKSTAPRRKTAAKPKAKQKPTNRKKATPQAEPQPRSTKPRGPADINRGGSEEGNPPRVRPPEIPDSGARRTETPQHAAKEGKGQAPGNLCRMRRSLHSRRDPMPELHSASPGVPKAVQLTSCPEKGEGIRPDQDLLIASRSGGRSGRLIRHRTHRM